MFNLPAGLTSLLDAVNVILKAIGEAPISDVEGSEALDVSEAKNVLNEFDKSIQSEGWSWNRLDGVKLNPDGSGHIYLPENTLRVVNAYPLRSARAPGVNSVRITQRGGRLFDRTNNTFIFTEGVVADLIERLDWLDLPEAARGYITIAAAQSFQGTKQVSATVDRILDRDVMHRRAILEQAEDEAEPKNSIHGNVGVQKALRGRGVRRRQ